MFLIVIKKMKNIKMTKEEAKEIIKKFKKLKFKCIAPDEVVEALKVLNNTSLAE